MTFATNHTLFRLKKRNPGYKIVVATTSCLPGYRRTLLLRNGRRRGWRKDDIFAFDALTPKVIVSIRLSWGGPPPPTARRRKLIVAIGAAGAAGRPKSWITSFSGWLPTDLCRKVSFETPVEELLLQVIPP